jgi:hypothetical protein
MFNVQLDVSLQGALNEFIHGFRNLKMFFGDLFIYRYISVKLCRSTKQHMSSPGQLMRRFVQGVSTNVHQVLIPNVIFHGLFPSCATRGAGVLSQAHTPSFPNITVNVMRPKPPSWACLAPRQCQSAM